MRVIEDFLPQPVRLAIAADAPIYYKIDLQRYLGTLKKGQFIELQAVSANAYRVRGMAQQGQVAGFLPLFAEFHCPPHEQPRNGGAGVVDRIRRPASFRAVGEGGHVFTSGAAK